MSNSRPNIGVTGPDKGGRAAWWFARFAVFLHGGRAIHIYPQKGLPDEDIHGLIIGGGADINPERYGAEEVRELFMKDEKVSSVRNFFNYLLTILFFPFIYFLRKILSASSADIDNNRDELEFGLIKQAVDKKIPILGICRGAQLLNIHFGGTLEQDITSYYTEVPRVHSVWPKKRVEVDENSMLYDILTFRKVWVNALHHQAVDELGKNLAVVAKEENGIVQAIEHTDRDFILGVQWHPEYMPQIPAQRRIFEQLVTEARARMKK
ncbi:gamma-glutamyl-gamma-aminobutyrate hydrolase [Aliifodinibius salipaludis]|uniref:Gamma-glutamyl-gamma-aminobutyrate hydrolase n=1 Tax=Fodinibius salipaludis TaxID=2032627 RepID=A0A2A2G7K2_9BACT|nr:type 1 glutamine amidotransferase [Aliifodinibius salipaludis]PAU92817.1 gamma-glutamyl-gamma-aminobutyrate hydrolase [Aliifodinibius salipaludis]